MLPLRSDAPLHFQYSFADVFADTPGQSNVLESFLEQLHLAWLRDAELHFAGLKPCELRPSLILARGQKHFDDCLIISDGRHRRRLGI